MNLLHSRAGGRKVPIHRNPSIFIILMALLLILSQSGCVGLTGAPVQGKPSISSQPTSQAVTVGQTATFSVTTSGDDLLSYQWRKDGTDIGGATSASYTTPATTLSDSGSSFTVVVTTSSISEQVSSQGGQNEIAISGATSATQAPPATATSENGIPLTVPASNSQRDEQCRYANGHHCSRGCLHHHPADQPDAHCRPESDFLGICDGYRSTRLSVEEERGSHQRRHRGQLYDPGCHQLQTAVPSLPSWSATQRVL